MPKVPGSHALRWAAGEAQAGRNPLMIVHAYEWAPPSRMRQGTCFFLTTDVGVDEITRAAVEERARALVATANDVVTESSARLSVLTRITEGPPAEVLSAAAQHAAMLVLGSHGRGLLGRMLPGSVSAAVAADPPCPLVVVREQAVVRAPAVVLVCLDDGRRDAAALSYAVEHAARHGAPLRLVQARRPEEAGRDAGDRLRVRLRDLASTAGKVHPSVDVTWGVLDGHPAQALIELSASAGLVVIAARGGNGAR
ncbi:universal stress protein [Phytomonospora sp. NPDC050363]|uniref:universal stress protein n=1 Tax=Phytomonospora sp. NPDC050363 TaxID=3155642 RepID=UPI0033FC94BE